MAAGVFTQGVFYDYLIFSQRQIFDRRRLGIIKGGVERLGLAQFLNQAFIGGIEVFAFVDNLF